MTRADHRRTLHRVTMATRTKPRRRSWYVKRGPRPDQPCEICGVAVEQPTGSGRPKLTCSPSHARERRRRLKDRA